MKKHRLSLFFSYVLWLSILFSAGGLASAETGSIQTHNHKIQIATNLGDIIVELYNNEAPITVRNFLEYANSGFYENTIFHRVIPGFMIQGGGFDASMRRKPTRPEIRNEAQPSLPNSRGTLAMARTSNPDSASSQFFININNNNHLNKAGNNPGYAVFGKVIQGMDVVDEIAKIKTSSRNGMQNVPMSPIIITSVNPLPMKEQQSK